MLIETSINYDTSFIFDLDWADYKDDSTAYHALRQKDLHAPWGGLPNTYNEHNTAIYQRFFSKDEIDFDELGKQLNIETHSISAIKQEPGNIIPLHSDTFYKVKQVAPDDVRPAVRANIFLEDWMLGHVIQFNNSMITDWEKHTGFIFDGSVPHLSANCGMQSKYTLQISGFLNG